MVGIGKYKILFLQGGGSAWGSILLTSISQISLLRYRENFVKDTKFQSGYQAWRSLFERYGDNRNENCSFDAECLCTKWRGVSPTQTAHILDEHRLTYRSQIKRVNGARCHALMHRILYQKLTYRIRKETFKLIYISAGSCAGTCGSAAANSSKSYTMLWMNRSEFRPLSTLDCNLVLKKVK